MIHEQEVIQIADWVIVLTVLALTFLLIKRTITRGLSTGNII